MQRAVDPATTVLAGDAPEDPAGRALVTLGDLLATVERRLPRLMRAEPEAVSGTFLDAAGIAQILEDRAIGAFWRTGRVSERVAALDRPRGAGAIGARAVRTAAPVLLDLRDTSQSTRAVGLAGRRWSALSEQLASLVLSPLAGGDGAEGVAPELTGRIRREVALTRGLAGRGGLACEVRRPPTCFMAFDQHPADVLSLARRFAGQEPMRSRPLIIVGLRTSGSYLAPLTAAALRGLGYRTVTVTSMRPGQPLRRREAAALAHHAGQGGLVLVIDDPPRTGQQMREAARALRGAAHDSGCVVLLVPLLADPGRVHAALAEERAVYLPFEEWAISAALHPQALAPRVDEALGGRLQALEDVEILPVRRGHVLARVTATAATEDGPARIALCAEGTGFGYFGAQARSIAARLADHVPAPRAGDDGLLIRDWLPDQARLDRGGTGGLQAAPPAFASYVRARAERLRLPEDLSAGLVARDAMPDLVGDLVAQAFGRARRLARPAARRVARRLLHVRDPAVVDGAMQLDRWFAADGGGLCKVAAARQAYSADLVASADPLLDLAVVAADLEWRGEDGPAAAVRAEYERLSGEPVGEERWLLYRLVDHAGGMANALSDAAAEPAIARPAFAVALARERAGARAIQHWIAGAVLPATAAAVDGPLCAIDVDGVLETRWGAFPAMGPAAAEALRRLHAHGRRAVLVTGRCVEEVRDRCRTYGLAAGVAEYGSAVYELAGDRVTAVVAESERDDLSRVRGALGALPRIAIDAAHEHSVRAFELTGDGRRRAVPGPVLDGVLADLGLAGRVRVVQGELQSDVVAASVDKGRGVRALAERLGVTALPGAKLLEMAIGDGPSDLPMLALAAQAFMPANATASAPRGARALRQGYGEAVLAAASAVVGCRGRRCAVCRNDAAVVGPGSRALLGALRALDGGPAATLRAAAALTSAL